MGFRARVCGKCTCQTYWLISQTFLLRLTVVGVGEALGKRREEIHGSSLIVLFVLHRQVCDVEWGDLRRHVENLGGFAVIKIPYSNAGQGVFTITSEAEMQARGIPIQILYIFRMIWVLMVLFPLMQAFERQAERSCSYQRFVVQGLIANHTWSSKDDEGIALYHVG
jgi:hypothetical protein